MHVLIIGGGLIGVTSAYALRRRGFKVTLIDREPGVARATSFANGGLLTPSMVEPWNEPGAWRVLLASLGREDAALQLRFKALPTLLGWGMAFLKNSNSARFESNALANLQLAMHSLRVMADLRSEVSLEYGRAATGSLRIFRDEDSLNHAAAAATRKQEAGLRHSVLSSDEIAELEPALAPISSKLSGGLYYPLDEVGNAYRFSLALADAVQTRGVEIVLGRKVSLEQRSGSVCAVLDSGERLVADRYVVAAGCASVPLLARIGVRIPVRPAKGYSVTLNRPDQEPTLKIPVVDDSLHAVVTPLEDHIRVAGTAEFAGYDLELSPARIRNLLRLVRSVLPEASIDFERAVPWCGLRPMSVDGVPIIGETAVRHVYVSTGHGHLGWTLAAASAELLAALMSDEHPSVDPHLFSPARFSI